MASVKSAGADISLEHAPMTRLQVGAVLVSTALNLIDGFDVLAIAFAAPSLGKEWKLPPDAIGMLLSAGLIGMTAGSLIIAPFADRWGRRAMVLLTLVVVSAGMLAASAAGTSAELAAARVFTGLGIGAMLPSINTIVAEYSSAKRRELSLSVMSTGYPVGAVLGGIAAIAISAHHGWRGIFVFGAALSIAMIPIVWMLLPESLEFILTRRPEGALRSANALLRRLGRAELGELPSASAGPESRAGARDLVAGSLGRQTALLWTAFFCVMFSFYFVLSWTPKLLVQAGLPINRGLSGAVLLNLGGICGTLLLGVLSARLGIFRLHTGALLASGVMIACFGVFSGTLDVALVVAGLVGFFLFTSMVGLYVITPSIYPTEVRNTGTGWAIGIGRVGAILSPYLAGLLLASGWTPKDAYVVFGIPTAFAAVAVLLLSRRAKASVPAI